MLPGKLIPDLNKFSGPKCKAIRTRFGIDIRELAAGAQVEPSFLEGWESRRERPTWNKVPTIHAALAAMLPGAALRLAEYAEKRAVEVARFHAERKARLAAVPSYAQ